MLVRDTKEVYRHKIEKAVGKDATGREVLDHLFGDGEYRRGADFVIREWAKDRRGVLCRVNMLWAVPLTLALAPAQWVLKGYIGWDTKTRFGRWVLRVTGHLIDA